MPHFFRTSNLLNTSDKPLGCARIVTSFQKFNLVRAANFAYLSLPIFSRRNHLEVVNLILQFIILSDMWKFACSFFHSSYGLSAHRKTMRMYWEETVFAKNNWPQKNNRSLVGTDLQGQVEWRSGQLTHASTTNAYLMPEFVSLCYCIVFKNNFWFQRKLCDTDGEHECQITAICILLYCSGLFIRFCFSARRH